MWNMKNVVVTLPDPSELEVKSLSGRKAKSSRGLETQTAILAAAHEVLQTHWLHEIPVVELSRRANATRTSLNFLFPGGWPEICLTLFVREINVLESGYESAVALRRVGSVKRVMTMLEALFQRAQACGRLYPNLRGQMFMWQDDDASAGRIALLQACDDIEKLLAMPPSGQTNRRGVREGYGELLLRLSLDLATLEGPYLKSAEEKLRRLRELVELITNT
jgi:AcrR family transcriptional regulator